MRRFTDLNVVPAEGRLEEMLAHASTLGFHAVGCPGKTASNPPLDVVSRLDLAPRSQQQLQSHLKKNRRRYEVISVLCLSKGVARQAARDHRVDLLRFRHTGGPGRVWLDRQQAALAGETGCCLELEARELLSTDPTRLRGILTQLRGEVENARRHGVPVILSSGAETPHGMRGPREMASLMSLVGVEGEEALDVVSVNPWALVERNRDKLSESYVQPGVRLMDT